MEFFLEWKKGVGFLVSGFSVVVRRQGPRRNRDPRPALRLPGLAPRESATAPARPAREAQPAATLAAA